MPREWIDREKLLKEYWKKQKSKQMTKLEELMAYADTAVDAACRCIGWLLGVLAALFVLNALLMLLTKLN